MAKIYVTSKPGAGSFDLSDHPATLPVAKSLSTLVVCWRQQRVKRKWQHQSGIEISCLVQKVRRVHRHCPVREPKLCVTRSTILT